MNVTTKQIIVAAARRAGILPVLEGCGRLLAIRRSRRANTAFLKRMPAFAPPPLWRMHEMYSHSSYEEYWRTGSEAAAAIARRIDAHCPCVPRVADWGCGLARVVRHLPAHYVRTGFDVNAKAINWCAKHIKGAAFKQNGARPPLPAPDGAFDAVYGISVFTHLSGHGHRCWVEEIARVLRPGGLLLATFHRYPTSGQLLAHERSQFDAGALVVRGGVKEGTRIYTAVHPEGFIIDLLSARFDLLEGPVPLLGQALFVARRKDETPAA